MLQSSRATPGDAGNIVLVPPAIAPVDPVPGAVQVAFGGHAFGTTWMVRLVVGENRADDDVFALRARLKARCEHELVRIDRQMSPWIRDSDLNRYNALPHGGCARLPVPMREVVANALAMNALTLGAFDPFLGEATDLWGFGPGAVPEGLPDADACEHLRHLRQAERPVSNGDLLVRREGFRLDLCGIAKGHAVDVLFETMRAEPHVLAVLVEIGGEARGEGVKPDGFPWWVELAWPGVFGGRRIVMAAHGWACASSGEDVRSFELGRRRYSHSMDPVRAEPVAGNLRGVSVIDRACWRADALATALLVMGRERALSFAEREGIACLLVPSAGRGDPVFSAALSAWFDA